MSETTGIGWTDHTGGPWLVCGEVSPGCDHCWARELVYSRLEPLIRNAYKAAGLKDWRIREVWGKTAPRVLTKGFWKDAIALNKKAKAAGTRMKMFPSMIDWLDNMPNGIIDQDGNWLDAYKVLRDFLNVMERCDMLDWLLLTKRPNQFHKRIGHIADQNPAGSAYAYAWSRGLKPPNVWIGVSVEDQERADSRIPALLDIPATIRFLSCEPLLGPVDLSEWLPNGEADQDTTAYHNYINRADGIQWVIVGGESGKGFRPMDHEWAIDPAEQCERAGVAFYMKQDSAFHSGSRGTLPQWVWDRKQFPK